MDRTEYQRNYAREWRANHPGRDAETARRYRERNPGRDRIRYHADPQYRAVNQLRCKLHDAVKRLPTKARLLTRWGARSTIGPLIGCSPLDLKSRLEALFLPGMSWANYGRDGWEIDHIEPCSAFDLTDPAQQAACFHFTNLRPLWARDNQRARRIAN